MKCPHCGGEVTPDAPVNTTAGQYPVVSIPLTNNAANAVPMWSYTFTIDNNGGGK